jgi:ubiquinone/menaquinone biosynthesis C-methylase UbiE
VTATLSDAYGAGAAAWAAGPARIYRRLADATLDCSPTPLRDRLVLDIGTGTGVAADAITGRGGVAIGSDVAHGMLALRRGERPPAAQADARALPFASRSVGGFVASFVLNHLVDPVAALREATRVTEAGGPVLASTYAHEDDSHPVRAAVDEALTAAGWRPDPWYEQLKATAEPLLATSDGCRDAARRAGLRAPMVHRLDIAFPELGVDDLVDWRLGMAQHSGFVRSLDRRDREAVRAAAIAALGSRPPILERAILVIAATA